MTEQELGELQHHLTRLITALIVVALLCSILALGGLVVAHRAIESADASRARQSARVTELQHRIEIIEDRGLAPK